MCQDKQESNTKEAMLLLNAIEQLRLHYYGEDKAQLLLNEMWTQPDTCPTKQLWVVGNRTVCHNCFCAAAGLRQSPSLHRKGK
jgi:negative regulator of replication initiation